MTRHTVRLAEAPTDVLVYLASRPVGHRSTVAEVAAVVAPADAPHPQATVADALVLLRDAGYAQRDSSGWAVADAGTAALSAARNGADPCVACAGLGEWWQGPPGERVQLACTACRGQGYMSEEDIAATLAALVTWERRHRLMRPEQRCTPDPFGSEWCVDDDRTLAQLRGPGQT